MNVLVNSSVWIDHLHRPDKRLQSLLQTAEVCTHPVVIGELACGSIKNRDRLLSQLARLTMLRQESTRTTLRLIETAKLWGRGLGWGDAQILAACRLERVQLWTRDTALAKAATDLEIPQPV